MTAPTRTLDQDLVVLGYAARITPQTAATEIPALWQRFMADQCPEKLGTPDGCLYAVYCDYQSDFSGPYTMVLGVKSAANAPVPDGHRRVRVPRGDYAVFPAKGAPAEVIWKTWQHINGGWAGASTRRYIADAERYPLSGMTPDTVDAEVLVGIG